MNGLLTRRGFVAGTSASLTFLKLFTRPAGSAFADDLMDEIHWGLPSVKDTMFIPRAWSTYVGAIMSLVQEGILAFGDDLKLANATAESWKQTDPTTYVYTLRQGVTFGDGSPMTADDVVATYKFQMDPKSGSQLSAFFGSVDSVTATGPNEVTVKLKHPDQQYQYTPAHMAGFVFKKEQITGKTDDLGGPDTPVLGTGPYKLTEFSPSERAVLEARDDYWGPNKPIAKKIVFTGIPDHQTRLLAMKNGDIDGTFDLAISEIDQWKALGNCDVITAPSLGVFVLTLDHTTAPLDDIHVRKAIAYAIDREGLVKALLKGNGEAATALNPPEIWGSLMSPDDARKFYATIPGYQFDLAKAKAELAQSGHKDGFDISVPGSTADPYMINILQSVAQNLKEIGITVKVQEKDDNTWLGDYFKHENLGMQIMAYYPDFPDPANYPYLFFDSANAAKDGMNGSNFKNADVDKAIDTALKESDAKTRVDALEQVFKLANEDVALVPIFWPASAMAINNKMQLKGYTAFWYNIPWAIRGFGPKTA